MMTPTSPRSNPTLAAQIARLPKHTWIELKSEWQRLYGGEPPIANRRFLERRIAYKLQELEFRKADPNLLERNRRRIDALIEKGALTPRRVGVTPVPGTVLVREYDGVAHRVVVTADGQFEYRERLFRSLSVIAREITGTRWSGPAFFGLRDKRGANAR